MGLQGLQACQTLAEELHAQQNQFEHLDPWQLLKHVLGLATSSGPNFSLWYLYHDCLGQRSDAHRGEIQNFADRVGHEIGFKTLTYQRAYHHLQDSNHPDPNYLIYLHARYFS